MQEPDIPQSVLERRIKVLHFIYGLAVGGAETFLLNTLPRMQCGRYQFDFAIQNPHITNEGLKEFITHQKSKVIVLPRFPLYIGKQIIALKKLLDKERYDFIHIHMNAALNPAPMIAESLSKSGVKVILHSHNSNNNAGGALGRFIHKINRLIFFKPSYQRMACSDLAGMWMFGSQDFHIVDNAVDTKRFCFDSHARGQVRRELGIPEDGIVLGSVGRMVEAKNHSFILDMFASYIKEHNNSYLLLVGDGPLSANIRQKAYDLGVGNNVFFTGTRTDIPQLMSSMDVFLMPSLHEGLAFTAIEAQSCGLGILASKQVTDMINLGHVAFLSLDAPLQEWLQEADWLMEDTRKNRGKNNPVKDSRYDIEVMIRQLDKIYGI